jgi:hypothetical protein
MSIPMHKPVPVGVSSNAVRQAAHPPERDRVDGAAQAECEVWVNETDALHSHARQALERFLVNDVVHQRRVVQ